MGGEGISTEMILDQIKTEGTSSHTQEDGSITPRTL